MRRRDFLGLLSSAATWPLAARAQQADQIRKVGVLIVGAESDPESKARATAFRLAFEELGWIDGRNVSVEYRYFSGRDPDRARNLAKELIGLGTEVILANSSPLVSATQHETSTIPIVFVQVGDPVSGGFVQSLSHPGGNITGFASLDYSTSPKWLELLKEMAPTVTRVAVLRDPTVSAAIAWLSAIQTMSAALRVQIIPIGVRDKAELEGAIAAFAREPNGGLIVLPSPLTGVHRETIIAMASQHRLPAVYPFRYHVVSGGLMSYGINPLDLFRRAAAYVDRILKGARPADLPVQAPTKYELIINLKTAKALGLEVPPTLLALADEVIE